MDCVAVVSIGFMIVKDIFTCEFLNWHVSDIAPEDAVELGIVQDGLDIGVVEQHIVFGVIEEHTALGVIEEVPEYGEERDQSSRRSISTSAVTSSSITSI